MTLRKRPRCRRRDEHRDERGSVSVWVALAALSLVVCLGIDLGGHVHAQQRASAIAAQAAARTAGEEVAAAQAIRGLTPTVDITAAKRAAAAYLAQAGVTGTVNVRSGTSWRSPSPTGTRRCSSPRSGWNPHRHRRVHRPRCPGHRTMIRQRLLGLAATLGIGVLLVGLPLVLLQVGFGTLPPVDSWADLVGLLLRRDDGTLALLVIKAPRLGHLGAARRTDPLGVAGPGPGHPTP